MTDQALNRDETCTLWYDNLQISNLLSALVMKEDGCCYFRIHAKML